MLFMQVVPFRMEESEIQKVSFILEKPFKITMGDLHYSFQRMKYRAGSRMTFLYQLKSSLEELNLSQCQPL